MRARVREQVLEDEQQLFKLRTCGDLPSTIRPDLRFLPVNSPLCYLFLPRVQDTKEEEVAGWVLRGTCVWGGVSGSEQKPRVGIRVVRADGVPEAAFVPTQSVGDTGRGSVVWGRLEALVQEGPSGRAARGRRQPWRVTGHAQRPGTACPAAGASLRLVWNAGAPHPACDCYQGKEERVGIPGLVRTCETHLLVHVTASL